MPALKRLYYCDHYEIPLPAGHRFPMRKYGLLREELERTGVFTLQPAPLATRADLELIHDPPYVSSFLTGLIDPALMRRIGFPWSENLVLRTLASVGGTIAASEEALRDGWGGNLAGGTHHAFHAEGSGFCVFNDLAVAVARLRRQGRVRRAAILDLDVHQGDGTAALFESETEVLTVSIHGRNNFPFRKRRSRIDADLPDGAGDEEYLHVLEALLPSVFDFRPEIVFYQSGVDALAEDKLGRLQLSHNGLCTRDRLVFGACRRAGVPVVVTLGGGYADPIELTVQAHAATFLTAAAILNEVSAGTPSVP
jgi:acetoin utilization deacetylase AcuC-like enzyme